MNLRSHGRYDFNPLPSRPAGFWPGGARLAFYVALNLEQVLVRRWTGGRPGAAARAAGRDELFLARLG